MKMSVYWIYQVRLFIILGKSDIQFYFDVPNKNSKYKKSSYKELFVEEITMEIYLLKRERTNEKKVENKGK